MLALERVDLHGVFNVGLGRTHSVKDLLSLILEAEGDADARVVFDSSKPAKAPSIAVDVRKAERELGFKARHSIEEGIRKTLRWFKETQLMKHTA